MALTPQTNTTLEKVADVIREHRSFALCGHVSPDGDCLGSQLALWHALRDLGKDATCLLVKDEPAPMPLAFLPGIGEMVPAASYDGEPEVFICLDVPSRERIGQDACTVFDKCDVTVTVDHHAFDVPMSQYVYVDPDSASTTMLVWKLVKLLVEEPSLESATCAYTGLLTDTGGFLYQNADVEAFCAAAELVGRGVKPHEVAMHAFQSRSVPSLKLEGVVIERMKMLCGGRGVMSWVTAKDFERFGAQKSDTEPLIDCLRSIAGVEVACMLREQDDVVRGSLRAKCDIDVAALARKHGGGGHKAAAGFTLTVPIDEAIALMEGEIEGILSL